MFKKLNGNHATALFTAAGVIVCAVYERYQAGTATASTFFYGAAAILLMPVLYGVGRHAICRNAAARRKATPSI